MAMPVVAIVGRPNVGKSSLFNAIAGRRISIVDPTSGVTRDRIMALVKAGEHFFEVVDTGGMGVDDVDNLTADIEHQIELAITQADLILFVLDVRTGIMPLDYHVAERLRGLGKPILCVANKCDTEELDAQAAEFYGLGFGDVYTVSASQLRNRKELIGAIVAALPDSTQEQPDDVHLKVAIVGRRNVGKSTFINSLAEADRVIVSEVAGTTRDSIDVRFERDGKTFIAIDTAGVRKKTSLASDIEFYSMTRAERSIRRADVVFLFFDPRVRVSKVDKRLTEYILEHHKPAIFVVNKWDLVRDKVSTEVYAEYLHKAFPMLDYVPTVFVTATEGKNVYKLLNLAQNLHKQACKRVKTGPLNQVLRDAIEAYPPRARSNRLPKIYFATQVAEAPPTIVLITNGPELFDETYQRYLLKTFRDKLPFFEVPIKLYLRAKNSQNSSDTVPDIELELAPSGEDSSVTPRPGKVRPPALPKVEVVQVEERKPKRAKKSTTPKLWEV